MADLAVIGLSVMGQNVALNAAEKGFKISVFNRSGDKTDACVARAKKEGGEEVDWWWTWTGRARVVEAMRRASRARAPTASPLFQASPR